MKKTHIKKLSPIRGFGLAEALLTLGAISALSLGIYLALKPSSASAQAKVEQDNLRELSTAIESSFGILGGYEGVSGARVATDRLAPSRMVRGGALQTHWGTTVLVNPSSVNHPNDAFVITYPGTPADVCSRLAAAVAPQVFDLRVNGNTVLSAGSLNPSETALRCSESATSTMEFVYHSGLVAGTAVAAPPLVMPPAVPPTLPPSTGAPVAGPVGPVAGVGGISPVAPVTIPPPVGAPATSPGLPPAPTPVTATPPPVPPVSPPSPPPTTVAACAVPPNSIENENVSCAAGQYGIIVQSRFATWLCPEAWDVPVQGPFSAWSTISNTCTACPGPSTQSQEQWVNASAPCPAGYSGSHTWQKQQRQTRSVSYNCPAGTTSLPGPTYGGWSAWADTGATRNVSNTCTPPPANGTCPTRPLELGCAVFNASNGARLSAVERGDYIGLGFDRGQYVACEFGYADAQTPEGFPAPLQGNDGRLIYAVRGVDQWQYGQQEDASSYMTVYARNADGSRGARCWGESKTMFNYEGK